MSSFVITACSSFGSASDPDHCHNFAVMGGKSNKSGPSGWAKFNGERKSKEFKETGSQVPPLRRINKKTALALVVKIDRPTPQTPPRKGPLKPEDIPTLLAPDTEDVIFQPLPGGRLLCSCCGKQGVVGWGFPFPCKPD